MSPTPLSIFQVALIAVLTGTAIGFAVGIWFAKRQLQSKVDSLLDFGGDEEVLDLSSAVENLDEDFEEEAK